jgi:hypothetical protein
MSSNRKSPAYQVHLPLSFLPSVHKIINFFPPFLSIWIRCCKHPVACRRNNYVEQFESSDEAVCAHGGD